MLFRQHVLPDTQLCQRDRETPKKPGEMEEGRQDYGFSNHKICGLLFAHSPLRSEEIKYRVCILMQGRRWRDGDHYFIPCIFL